MQYGLSEVYDNALETFCFNCPELRAPGTPNEDCPSGLTPGGRGCVMSCECQELWSCLLGVEGYITALAGDLGNGRIAV